MTTWAERFYGTTPRRFRWFIRMAPPIRRTGVKVDRISDDWTEWDIRLPHTLKTNNYVGTQWGGGIYAASDPWFMFAWMHILGPDYVVWDKAATVRFKRPGRGTLHGKVRISDGDIAYVKRRCDEEPKFDLTFPFEWLDDQGTVVAEIDKTLHFRRKRDGDRGYDA